MFSGAMCSGLKYVIWLFVVIYFSHRPRRRRYAHSLSQSRPTTSLSFFFLLISTRSGVYVSAPALRRVYYTAVTANVMVDCIMFLLCLCSVNVRVMGAPDNILIAQQKAIPAAKPEDKVDKSANKPDGDVAADKKDKQPEEHKEEKEEQKEEKPVPTVEAKKVTEFQVKRCLCVCLCNLLMKSISNSLFSSSWRRPANRF